MELSYTKEHEWIRVAGDRGRVGITQFVQEQLGDMQTYTQEWLCSQIEDAADAIIFADRDGTIRLWNSGAQAMFGYRADEAVGQTLDLVIPEKLRARYWEGYHAVMAMGVTRYGWELLKVPGIRKDGTRISLEFSILLVLDPAGAPMGAAAIIRDVTERWQQEKTLQDRLGALESQSKQGRPHTEA